MQAGDLFQMATQHALHLRGQTGHDSDGGAVGDGDVLTTSAVATLRAALAEKTRAGHRGITTSNEGGRAPCNKVEW